MSASMLTASGFGWLLAFRFSFSVQCTSSPPRAAVSPPPSRCRARLTRCRATSSASSGEKTTQNKLMINRHSAATASPYRPLTARFFFFLLFFCSIPGSMLSLRDPAGPPPPPTRSVEETKGGGRIGLSARRQG